MAKGHRSQIKRERNENNREKRPHAKLSHARIPIQKACFVVDAIRGKNIDGSGSDTSLHNPETCASEVILKLVNSAIANAENNNGMDRSKLYIAECYASQGPMLKRIQPRAQGRAYRILKRMSHITVVLDERS